MSAHQAVVQNGQLGAKGVRAFIAGSLERGGQGRTAPGQDQMGRRQPRIDLTQGAAIGLVRPLDRGVDRGLGQGRQLRCYGGQLGREAELFAQGVHLLQIEAQHGARLGAEGGGQNRGVDIGIAVAIAADPGADAQEGRQVGRVQQGPPLGQLGRGDVQEDALQPVGDGVDLVLHHQARGAGQPRGPEDDDLAAQFCLQPGRRAGDPVAVAAVQQTADSADAVDDALAPDFGRVGGQDRRDQGVGQQVAHRRPVHPRRVQPLQRALGGVGAFASHGLFPRAALARPVLGDIGQQGEGGEAVGQADGLVQRHIVQQGLQLGRPMRGRVAVIGHRGLPHRLDPVVEFLAALVADDLAQQGAQQANFIAEGVVGGLDHRVFLQRGGWERNRISGIRPG